MTDQRDTETRRPMNPPNPDSPVPSMTIPDTAEGLAFTPWRATDYGPVLTGSGAAKCAESGIAPLIARARGLKTIFEPDVKDLLARLNITATTNAGKQIKRIVGQSEGMLMPWMTGDDATRYWDHPPTDPDVDIVPSSTQMRPAPENVLMEEINGKMKARKYENLAGQDTVISIHPSIPRSWVVDADAPIFFTEGMLKADSALTAVLRDAGVPDEDLDVRDGETLFEARTRLRDLMETVPHDKRVAVYAFLSVTTWDNKAEWSSIRLKGRMVLVAFDGDVATNEHVYRQARKLFTFLSQKHAEPRLMDLSGITVESGSKIGVDDYLAGYGTWSNLMQLVTAELPLNPSADVDVENGDMRCKFEEAATEVFVDGAQTGGQTYWKEKFPYAARLVSIEVEREATDKEEATGRIDVDLGGTAEAVLEFNHRDHLGERHLSTVTGPGQLLLSTGPEAWAKSDKVTFNGRITQALHFPPSRTDTDAFRNAMKSCMPDQVRNRPRWDHMGWVPTDDGKPVFIIGEQVIDADSDRSTMATTSVSETTIASFGRFGVTLPETDAQAADALRRVLNTYRPEKVDDPMRIWNDPAHAAIIIAAALRPTVPIAPHLSVVFTGISGGGKSIRMDGRFPVPVSEKFPTGWALNRELEVGDTLYGPDGTETTIRGLSQIWTDEDMYEMTLSDGQVLHVSGNHVMNVSTQRSRQYSSLFRKNPARGHETERAAAAARLRDFAGTFPSGDAATIAQLCALTGHEKSHLNKLAVEYGLPRELVLLPMGGQKVKEFDVSAMTGLPDGIILPDHITRYDLRIALCEHHKVTTDGYMFSEPVKRLTKDVPFRYGWKATFKEQYVYPVAEMLYAVAEKWERGAEAPALITSVTVADMADALWSSPTVGYGIPVAGAIRSDITDLPVPAYTLGAWLGDGTTSGGGITGLDKEVWENIEKDGFEVTHYGKAKDHYVRGLVGSLRAAGVLNNKHIPAAYLRASEDTRLALLQGIVDTDGTVALDGQTEIALCNERLARDTLELVRSLGIKASFSSDDAALTETVDGEKRRRVTGTRWRIKFTTDKPVARLARKVERLPKKLRSTSEWIYVTDIKKVETVDSRCLQVEHPTGCFLTEDFVITHNSWSSARIMDFWSSRPGAWGVDQLPGTASDTKAAMELAIARTPIWVADDVAPNAADPQAADRARGAIADIIRNVYNRNSRGRATSGMKAQRKFTPRAVFVTTMEDGLVDDSAINRAIEVPIVDRLLNKDTVPTKALEAMTENDCPQSIVTGYLIRMFARKVEETSWQQVRAECRKWKTDYQRLIASQIGDDKGDATARHTENIADLTIGLWALTLMCDELGLLDLKERVMDMWQDILLNARGVHKERVRSNVGAIMLRTLASELKSNQCYVDALGQDGQPMPEKSDFTPEEIDSINRSLGWARLAPGEDRKPIGRTRIGGLFWEKGEWHVLFDTAAAFRAAARVSQVVRSRSEKQAWQGVINSHLTSPHMKAAAPDWRHRRIRNKIVEFGISVPLVKLLGLSGDATLDTDLDS